jgi:peptidyl-tRNA hydrolase, PTH1 family
MNVRMVVGLGNPGISYEKTRHNLGFRVVKALAKKHGMSFRRDVGLSARLAHGEIAEVKVILAMPLTFMNLSGEPVRLCLNYFHIAHENLLVVCDDIALPFGTLRERREGGTGGHKGLKSVEAHLQTQVYPRLRIGVGDREQGDLNDHVLGDFTGEEEEKLPEIIEKAVEIIEKWIAHPEQDADEG